MARQPKAQIVIDGKDNTKGAFGAVDKNLAQLEKRTAAVGKAMAGALAGAVSIGTLKAIGQINSEWIDMSSRLRRVTADEEEFRAVTERLGEVAESTWTGLNETIESYLSMQGPLADMGYTTMEQVNFVSALNNALVVSGAKKEVAASVQSALNKAMATGVLRGQNLNTVIEKGGRVADLLADHLGVTVSELRKLGAEGKITGEVMYEALAGNMQMLAEEADAMPATFEDAMQRVNESIAGAFRDDELMQPITDSLLQLAEVLNDPAVRQGLADLAASLVAAAKQGVKATSEISDGLGSMALRAKQVHGLTTELEILEHDLRQIERSLKGTGMDATLGSLLPTSVLERQKKQLESWIEMIRDGGEEAVKLEREIKALKTQLSLPAAFRMPFTGTASEIKEQIAAKEKERDLIMAQIKERKEQAEIAKQTAEEQKKIMRDKVNELRAEQTSLINDAKKAAKDLEKIEKDSNTKLKTLKEERLDIEKTYRQAIANLSGTSEAKEATYGNAQALKVKARQSLTSGDLKEAQEYARGALGILQKIKEEGGNTYGFTGFAKELEEIELKAKDVELDEAEKSRRRALDDLHYMKYLADRLEDIKIGFDLDQGQVEAVKAQLQAIGNAVQITPQADSAAGTTVQPVKLPVEAQIDEEPVKQKIYRIGNTFTDKPLTIPLEPEKIEPDEIQQAAGDTEIDAAVELDQESAVVLEGDIKSMVENLEKLATVQVKVQTAPAGGAGEPPGFAKGGLFRGRGTGTSDSNLIRISDEEFIVRNAIVRQRGMLPLLNAINRHGMRALEGLSIPGFADGGLVGKLSDTVADMEPRQPQSLGTLNFNLPGGEHFSVQTAGDWSEDLRRAAMKFGKPTRR